jgi:predicted metal-dependent enzyme (double-stranded beta helix superfamily)
MTADLLLEHRAFDAFLREAQGVLTRAREPEQRLRALIEPLQHLLMEDFLASEFTAVSDDRGYSQYLLYRSSDRKVSIVALAVAPKVKTPIHDHDTWGVSGLYQGSQVSRVFRQEDSRRGVKLSQTRKQRMKSGDVAVILPPGEDIRMVEATSKIPAVSISVLGADIGCERRRTFEKRSGDAGEFVLGYSNVPCR